MAQLLVRNLDEDLVRRLKLQAAAHGRSAEEEHREILREADWRRCAPMSGETERPSVVYLDYSALVKLVVAEPESAALRRYLRERPARVSCALARVEVARAVRRHGREAMARARQVLDRTRLLRVDDALLDAAADLDPGILRNLDAIHAAACRAFGDALDVLVTHDAGMAAAAALLDLEVASPS